MIQLRFSSFAFLLFFRGYVTNYDYLLEAEEVKAFRSSTKFPRNHKLQRQGNLS